MNTDRLRDKAQDILWGAGIAEIGTSVYVHEEKLAIAGIGLMVLSGLIEQRKDPNQRG